jgi:hypothetical protein
MFYLGFTIPSPFKFKHWSKLPLVLIAIINQTMKKINLVTLIFLVACSFTMNSHEVNPPMSTSGSLFYIDNPLVLKVEMLYDTRVVKISFNDVNSGVGQLKVMNVSGQVIYQLDEIDLNQEPYFFAVDCGKLQAGDLTFEVTTKTGVYKAVVKI